MALDEQVAVADSSAATDTAEIPAVEPLGSNPVPVVEELTGTQREKWLKEPSEYPKRKRERAPKSSQSTDKAESSTAAAESPKSDEQAASSPADSPEKVEPAETAAAPAPAESTQVEGKQPSEAEKRIKSLLSDNKLLKQKLSQYEQPAAAKQPTAEAAKDPQRPDPKKFETLDEYFEALSDYKVEKALLGERERVSTERQQSQQQQQMRVEREQWNSKISEARKQHADFDTIALNPDLPVAEGSAIDWWVMNSEHGAEMLYHYGQHPDQLEALNQLPPIEAARELAKLEMNLLTPSKPAPAVVSKAPRPPTEANPKGKIDPLAAALQAGDFATYRRLKDAEERGKRS